MFSEGTFQRYLFEIDSSQRRTRELYTQLAERMSDPAVRAMLSEFLAELDAERPIIERLRSVSQAR